MNAQPDGLQALLLGTTVLRNLIYHRALILQRQFTWQGVSRDEFAADNVLP